MSVTELVEAVTGLREIEKGTMSIDEQNTTRATPRKITEVGTAHVPLVLDAAAGKRKDIKVFGTDYDTPDSTCIRDYIHVTDLARAHVLALEKLLNDNGSTVLNLGQGKGYSVLEVIEKAREVTARKIKVVHNDRRPGDPSVLVASNAKAVTELGWQPELSNLDDIIKTAWNWHQKL